MTKEQVNKKNIKKAPVKNLKEKRAAKAEKRSEKKNGFKLSFDSK